MAQEFRTRWADEAVRNRVAATTQDHGRRHPGAAVLALLALIAGLLLFIAGMAGDGADLVRLLAALR